MTQTGHLLEGGRLGQAATLLYSTLLYPALRRLQSMLIYRKRSQISHCLLLSLDYDGRRGWRQETGS